MTLFFGAVPIAKAGVYVNPFTKSDGTYVDEHYRSDPDSDPYNNYGFPGNLNPNTGKTSTGNPDTYLKNYYDRQSSDQSPGSLWRYLNPSSPSTVYIRTPQKSATDRLAEDQKFYDDLEAKKKELDQRLYDLRNRDTSGILYQCPNPVISGCSTENDYSQLRAMWSAQGYPATMQANLDECRAKIDEYIQAMAKYNQCIADWQTKKFNSIVDKQIESDRLKRESDYYEALLKKAEFEHSESQSRIQKLIQDQMSCTSQHGDNSFYSSTGTRCECKDNFAPDSNTPFTCIPIEAYCKIEAGVGAVVRRSQYVDAGALDTNCACGNGYQWNSSKSQCVAQASEKSVYEQYQTKTGIFAKEAPENKQQPGKSAIKPKAATFNEEVENKAAPSSMTQPLASNPPATVAQPEKQGFISRAFNGIDSFFRKLKFW